jgi:hypothetical protein
LGDYAFGSVVSANRVSSAAKDLPFVLMGQCRAAFDSGHKAAQGDATLLGFAQATCRRKPPVACRRIRRKNIVSCEMFSRFTRTQEQ